MIMTLIWTNLNIEIHSTQPRGRAVPDFTVIEIDEHFSVVRPVQEVRIGLQIKGNGGVQDSDMTSTY